MPQSFSRKMCASVKWKGIVLLVLSALFVNGSKDVIKNLTINFTKALDVCKVELNLGDHIMQDFYNFWKEDYPLVNNELGCAIMCLANKLDLVAEDLTVHHENTHNFATKHGADDDVARHIVQILHECEKIVYSKAYVDDCVKVLEIAKCFRTRIHALQWAPTMEVVLEEVMTDM